MAWITVTVVDKVPLDEGRQRINVRFATDDPTPRTFECPIDIPANASAVHFDSQVRLWLKRLAERDAVKAQADAVAVGDYTPGPEPPGDPDQGTLDIFLAAVRKLQSYRRAVELEIIPATDNDYTTLRDQVQQYVANRPALKDKLITRL
jgi:hypothetical protein